MEDEVRVTEVVGVTEKLPDGEARAREDEVDGETLAELVNVDVAAAKHVPPSTEKPAGQVERHTPSKRMTNLGSQERHV